MASLLARTPLVSRSQPSALPRIWRTVAGSISSSLLQFRSNSHEEQDGRAPHCRETSSTAHLSGEFPPAAPTTQSFRAYRSVDDRQAFPVRKCKNYRIKIPSTILGFRRTHPRCCFSTRQVFVCGTEVVPFGATCEPGSNTHLASATGTSQAIAILTTRQQQGRSIDSYTLIDILKQCSDQKDLIATRQVHDYIIKNGMEKHPYVATTLLNAYIRCGRLLDARRVFDGLLQTDRTVITWNIMIGAYAKRGFGVAAYKLFIQMNREGFIPDAITCLNILNASASGGALEWVKEVHSHALKAGLESDLRVGNALVHMYAKSGSIDDARLIFDRLKAIDVITWNTMIGAYAESGSGEEAYKLFDLMKREGFVPNAITCLRILNDESASVGALEWVKEVHRHALNAGLASDVRVGTALVRMYAKCGSIDDARLVFDRLEKRNMFTWNVMIGAYAQKGCGVEAFKLFDRMKGEGFIPNAITCLSILNDGSASVGALEWVKEVHSHALKAGLESDVRVGNALVHMYAKSGSVGEARLIFERLQTIDVITWNIMISAYAENGSVAEAYQLFYRMKREGFTPNAITFLSILNASASLGLEWVKEVHSHALKAGLGSDVRVITALIGMYAKSGSIIDARLGFDSLEKRNIVTWNVMIGAYAENGSGMEAYKLFDLMKREGFTPNAITCLSILNASASVGALEWVGEVHNYAIKTGLDSDVRVGNALVHMYAKSGSIGDARLVFDRLKTIDVITWNTMIGAYAESGCGAEAYQLFDGMVQEGFVPDAFTYVSILNAAASAGALDWVKDVHSHALKAGLDCDVRVGNALVHMYARSGSIEDAQLIFDRMENRDVITWNTMIGALAQHGCGQEALNLFERMSADSVKPDGPTLVAVLSACSHAGLVDDGRRLFRAMKQDYGVEATVVHYTCMVDALGRAGHLEEAKLLIDSMPMEPNAVTWTALLGACRTHCNVELGELAANEAFRLEPRDSAPYVLLSNIYAATGRWEKVVFVRNMMQKRGVRKEPGRSWIAVDGKVHEFVVRDTSHPESTEIYRVLQELTERLRAKGYVPDTRIVLHNIHGEDKELVLCSHSEKLAIAYGLLRVPRGEAIRLEKNLRICPDCHVASKLISEVTGREIIAKDAHRFHHFKDGVCSCGDYW